MELCGNAMECSCSLVDPFSHDLKKESIFLQSSLSMAREPRNHPLKDCFICFLDNSSLLGIFLRS